MPFKKGKIKTGGKVKGSGNIATKKGRELFLEIMEGEIDNVKESLNQVRSENPYNYLNVLSKLLPYFMPKLSDITSKGEKIVNQLNITVPDIETKDLINNIDEII